MNKKLPVDQESQASSSGSPVTGEPEFLAVGKLTRPHGVHGEMRMMIWTDFPERLQPGKKVFIGDSYQALRIKNLRGHVQNPIISFKEFSNRAEVGGLRNQIVYVKTADLPSLSDGGIYLHKLLGLRVISDQDDEYLGDIVEILETGANYVFVVRKPAKKDILIPDIEPVVLSIDLKKKEIRVHLIPGLIPDDLLSSE